MDLSKKISSVQDFQTKIKKGGISAALIKKISDEILVTVTN